MQKLYSKIKISLGNDEFLVVKRESYGNLLISLINAKLPEDFRLHLGRNFKNNMWNLDELFNLSKTDVKAKECLSAINYFEFYFESVENHCRKFLLQRLYLIIAITIIRLIATKRDTPYTPFANLTITHH